MSWLVIKAAQYKQRQEASVWTNSSQEQALNMHQFPKTNSLICWHFDFNDQKVLVTACYFSRSFSQEGFKDLTRSFITYFVDTHCSDLDWEPVRIKIPEQYAKPCCCLNRHKIVSISPNQHFSQAGQMIIKLFLHCSAIISPDDATPSQSPWSNRL